MNDLTIFRNNDFGEMRTLTQNGEPWFVAADVCRALDLSDTFKAVERLDEDEKGTNSIRTLGGVQEMTIVNEPGLYALVLGSRKPEAKTFRRWITHEVIPAIRKTGSYTVTAGPNSENKRMEAEARLNNSHARMASEMRKLAELAGMPDTYKQVLASKATEVMTGQPLPD